MMIRLLQWNVLFREDPQRLLAVLREVDADVLCLQELTTITGEQESVNVPGLIAHELELHEFYQVAQEWDAAGERRTIGNGIFSKFPFERTNSVFVRPSQGPNPHDPSKEGRAYIEVDIALPGDTHLTVGTTHLSYIPRGIMTPEKRHEIDAFLAATVHHTERTIITGDFNEPPESYTVQALMQSLQHCGPPFEVLTWPTRPFQSMDHTEDELGWRIDYAFATKDLTIVEARVVETDVSDHLPILIELETPAQ